MAKKSEDNAPAVDPVVDLPVVIDPVSSVDPAAPPCGGEVRKPKNWEPPIA